MSRDFFAASNSAQGFKNYYGECFGACDRLLIVKGGPGTGKSTLMKKIAMRADQSGAVVERYYCSSDHTSLDGVRFFCGGELVGVIDGTFPHPYIERHPGVCEEIINTGDFWDRRILKAYAERVRQLCAQKAHEYELSYIYLRACGNLRLVCRSLDSGTTDREKLERIIQRMLGSLKNGKGYAEIPSLVNCIGMKGEAHLDTFEREASRIYLISGEHLSDEFLCRARELARGKGLRIRVAYHPIFCDELDGIYLEDERIWIACEGACGKDIYERFGDKITRINQARFITDQKGDPHKKDRKYAARLLASCRAQAKEHLARAGEHHFALEEIYQSAMNFSALEDFCESVCKRIFG